MYPSDLTDVQWSKLERLLKEPRGERHAGGRPRKYPLRRVVDALLYVVKTGCQWRQLPADFPPWLSVHQQFRAWRNSGFWERITKTLCEQGRQAKGRKGERAKRLSRLSHSRGILPLLRSGPLVTRSGKQLPVRRTCSEDRWEHYVRCPGAHDTLPRGLRHNQLRTANLFQRAWLSGMGCEFLNSLTCVSKIWIWKHLDFTCAGRKAASRRINRLKGTNCGRCARGCACARCAPTSGHRTSS